MLEEMSIEILENISEKNIRYVIVEEMGKTAEGILNIFENKLEKNIKRNIRRNIRNINKNYFTSSDPHRDIILKHICHKF